MARTLYRLGRTAFRRWPIFLAAWLVTLVAAGAVVAGIAKPMTDSFSIPGIPSEKAADLQEKLFPESVDAFDRATLNIVVAAPEGHTLTERPYREQVDELLHDLARLPQMPPADRLVNPADAARGIERQVVEGAMAGGATREQAEADAAAVSPLSPDGRTGLVTFDLAVEGMGDVEPATVEAVEELVAEAGAGDLRVEANGPALVTMPESGASELIGIAVALMVLLVTFGSVVAAGLPILTAVLGLGTGILGVVGATAFTDIGTTTPMLASMIGLAVGIDYALFILARYRSELHHTDDRAEAVGIAVGTAGSSVVFAGLTVLIALAALSVVRIPFLTSMGLAAAFTVLVAVLVALTLLPALLGMLRSRAFGLAVRRHRPRRDDRGLVVNHGVRWARLLGRAPVAAIVLAVVVLGVLALPVKDLHLAFPTDSNAAADTTQRQASDLVAEGFGPGREAPMLIVVDTTDIGSPEERAAALGAVVGWAAGQDGVRNAQVVATNEAGTGSQVMVQPVTGPSDTDTEELLAELRAGQSQVEADTGADLGVTGLTAIQVDVSERLSDALPVYLAVVIGLAFLLLMLVFRSVLVPLTATLGFLLSVLATLGATVAIFQRGLLGLMEGQPIVSFMPIILIGVVFGLAMDYQVFLVTRIREAHVHGASTREAVVDGFRNSARVVTAAALIMTSVFAAFMLQDDPMIKSMGFALAAAVLFDAFLVRMVLVPALLDLIGERVWWLPRWLDRLLPNVDVEGESLERPHVARQWSTAALDEELEPVR